MQKEELAALIPKVPRDEEGFVPDFAPNDPALQKFLEEFDFVVVRILDAAECKATTDEFWSEARRRQKALLAAKASPEQYRPRKWIHEDDPSSWMEENWPFARSRFLVTWSSVSPQALHNRTHSNIYRLFSSLLRTPNIFAHPDAWGLMRATQGLEWRERSNLIFERKQKQKQQNNNDDDDDDDDSEGDQCSSSSSDSEEEQPTYVDKPEWRTNLLLHIDVNPWDYSARGEVFYQGVLALVDCDDATGGFVIVPSSAKHLKKWCAVVPKSTERNHLDIPAHDPWYAKAQRVPIRQGRIVVWNSGAMHTNFANSSDHCRLVQYVRCVSDSASPPQPPAMVKQDLPTLYEPSSFADPPTLAAAAADAAAAGKPLSELQEAMLMLRPYPPPPKGVKK